MDTKALRTWGIAVSAVLMVGALALAAQPDPQARAEQPAQLAQVEAAPVSFLVRFRGGGPIARAQAAAATGDAVAAGERIAVQLQRQSAFSGLCFDRFTAGAAEVVLETCAPVAPHERTAVSQRWLADLRAMRAVAYADENTTATPGRAG